MKSPLRPRLTVEQLEARDVPSAVIQTLQNVTPPALPSGWSQWSNNGTTVFATASGAGVNGEIGLVSNGTSATAGLAWETASEPGDTGVSVEVDVNTLVPEFDFIAGSGLGTTTPSYLAAVVTRGVSVSLVQVTNGTATVLASLSAQPSAYYSANWVDVSLVPSGSAVGVQVVREDTGAYLNAQGTWQASPTDAVTATTPLAAASGMVGVGRFAQYAGSVAMDQFSINASTTSPPPSSPPSPPTSLPSAISQSFDATAQGATPSGWQSWVSNSAGNAGVSSAISMDGPNGYAFSGASNTSALAWSTTSLAASSTASAAIYANSLIPAEVFVDGSNLGSSTPTYDAVTVTRGLQVSLIQMVNGQETTLASLSSPAANYLSGQWVQATLTVQGNSIEASIYCPSTGKWLTSSGTWSSTQTIALTAQAAELAGGYTGIGRLASYAGTVTFDNFSASETASPASPPPIAINPDPTAAVSYAPAPASDTLFGPNGPSYLDVNQGADGDCWLIATLAEIAVKDPQAIENMFTYDGTTVVNGATVGVYTVRFYNSSGVANYVTVDTELPDGGGWYDQPVNGVLWVALAEKAYAVANGLGYVSSGDSNTSSYAALNVGYPEWAIQAVTGLSASSTAINPTQIASAWSAGDLIVLSTTTPSSSEIVPGHSYAVVGYNASTGQYELMNSWGGTTANDECPQDPQVYGLFWVNASFLSANFAEQSIASTATRGT